MDKHVPVNRLVACLSVLTLVFALWYAWRMGKFGRLLGLIIGLMLFIGVIGAILGVASWSFIGDTSMPDPGAGFIQVSAVLVNLLIMGIMYLWATEYNKKHWGYPDHNRATYKMNRMRDDIDPEDL